MPLRNLPARYRKDCTFDILARHGYYFLRYEFKLADYQALSLNRLDIHSVADLVARSSDLYLFLAREIRNFCVFERAAITDDMTVKERKIAEGLNKYGYSDFLRKRLAACTSTTPNGLKTARCKVRRELVSVVDRYGTGNYNSRRFRIDLGRNLVRISKHDPALNLPEALRTLLGKRSRRAPYDNKEK